MTGISLPEHDSGVSQGAAAAWLQQAQVSPVDNEMLVSYLLPPFTTTKPYTELCTHTGVYFPFMIIFGCCVEGYGLARTIGEGRMVVEVLSQRVQHFKGVLLNQKVVMPRKRKQTSQRNNKKVQKWQSFALNKLSNNWWSQFSPSPIHRTPRFSLVHRIIAACFLNHRNHFSMQNSHPLQSLRWDSS